MVRALGHNSRGPEVFTCLLCLLRGMRLAVFVCLFVVVGWFSFFFFSFFFFEVQRNEERGGKKSSHLFLQETKFQERVCMAVYLQGLVLNVKIIIFFPSV